MKSNLRTFGAALMGLVLTLVLAGGVSPATGVFRTAGVDAPSVPTATCGPGSLPETSIQGRVPTEDFESGRAAKGYQCNATQVAHQGATGGFKAIRYTDARGNTCAFYDSTLAFPTDALANVISGDGLGVVVLDMNDPSNPRRTANLTTPAMLSPHESLVLNQRRGLLVAVMGNAVTAPGIMDIYDVRTDCRHPALTSSTLSGVLGHESGFAPDGRTFYASSAAASLVAVDVSDPRRPRILFTQLNVMYHGMRLSSDGRTMYAANIGRPRLGGASGGGLRIVDVSQIQDRKPQPRVKTLSSLTWSNVSIPQVAEPFTRNGRHYLLEVDEYADQFQLTGVTDPPSTGVGAARIIDVQDPRHPRVVSDIRLQVHQLAARRGPQMNDPGASSPVQGYAGHYCSVPTRDNPDVAACSMILSGLRVFDIRDVKHPREAAYFNKPRVASRRLGSPLRGGYAMSQPAWDRKRTSIWYTDGTSGFYVVKLTNKAAELLR